MAFVTISEIDCITLRIVLILLKVVKIETEKYFRFLLDTVTEAGGTVQLGVSLTAKGVEEMKQSRHVVNCLGEY